MVSAWLEKRLQCPSCSSCALTKTKLDFTCKECGIHFPIFNGVPLLIDPHKSLFSPKDLIKNVASPTKKSGALLSFLRTYKKYITPQISKNFVGRDNYAHLRQLLSKTDAKKNILIVGGGDGGAGIDELLCHPLFNIVKTDVYFAPDISLICDANSLPFKKESFDAVVIQAVLEHVVDPYQCVEEIYRVLKRRGFVYAETPFMQQVHLKQYDFTRFTDLGHRRLFRRFEEIKRGVCCGPAMALAWSWRYFLVSLTNNFLLRLFLDFLARATSFWLKYLDPLLAKSPGAHDAASGFFFLGVKSQMTLDDKSIIASFRGYKGH